MVTLVIKGATDFLVITFNVVINVPIAEPGQRSRSAAVRLLELWARIPLGALMSVSLSVVFCHVEVSATGRSLVQRSPTDCGVSEYDHETNNEEAYIH